MIAGTVIFIFEIPTELIIIFSEPFIRFKKAKIEAKNEIKGRVK